jgi:uncharacterized membrane protein
MEARQETITAAAKITPAIGGAAYTAMTLNEWVALATLVYVLLQIGLLVPKYYNGFKAWKAKRNG